MRRRIAGQLPNDREIPGRRSSTRLSGRSQCALLALAALIVAVGVAASWILYPSVPASKPTDAVDLAYLSYLKANPPRPGSSILLAMNASQNPCDDFYNAACGGRTSLSAMNLSLHMWAVEKTLIAPISSKDVHMKTLRTLQPILESNNKTLEASHAFNQTRGLHNACKASGMSSRTCVLAVWNRMPSAMIVVYVLRYGFPRATYKGVQSVFEKVRTELDLLVSDGIVRSWVSGSSLSFGGAEDPWKVDKRYKTLSIAKTDSWLDALKKVDKWNQEFREVDVMKDSTAFYDPFRRLVYIRPDVLQYPFYNVTQTESLNYGGLGSLIGHELSHAAIVGSVDRRIIDTLPGDVRRKIVYDKDPIVFAQQLPQKHKVARLLSMYREFATNHPTAPLTQTVVGEIVADFLGVQASFNASAFRKVPSTSRDAIADGLESFTQQQLFFYTYALQHCDRSDEPSATHPAPGFRVNGILSLLPQFASAFKCSVGSPMNRDVPFG